MATGSGCGLAELCERERVREAGVLQWTEIVFYPTLFFPLEFIAGLHARHCAPHSAPIGGGLCRRLRFVTLSRSIGRPIMKEIVLSGQLMTNGTSLRGDPQKKARNLSRLRQKILKKTIFGPTSICR